MELKEKYYIALAIVACLLGSSLGYALGVTIQTPSSGFHRDPQPTANVYYIFETSRGTWSGQAGNVITNIGENYVRNILGWDNVTANNATQWIALGNSTISASNTKLDTEATGSGFARSANDTCLAWMNGTDYAYNVTNRFTATGTIRVNASSIHWNPTSNSDNNAYAMASITATTFENNDNCTIVWVLTWDCN